MQLEPQNFINQSDPQIILKSISCILEEIIQETDRVQIQTQKSVFYASKKPSISIQNYLVRINKYSQCSNSCFILALIFIDRIQQYQPQIIINSLCVHRILITAILIAIKYNDDEYYKNEFYAKVGGISLKEVNELEKDFLKFIDYELYVDSKIYLLYQERIQQYIEI